MTFRKWSMLLVLVFALAACSNNGTSVESAKRALEEMELEESEAAEESNKERAFQLLEEDLAWMSEQNSNVHAPYESHIIDFDTHEPIGPHVQYNVDEGSDFDVNRYPFFVSFHGKQYKLELGWTGPNLHTLSYTELSDSIRARKEGWFSEPFSPFIHELGFAFDPSDWQITAADLDGDGMLEIIVTARYTEDVSTDKILAVYRFTDDEEEPFELAVHLQTAAKSYRTGIAQQFRVTKAKEIVAENWDFEEAVAYFEDGDWYVTVNHYLPASDNLSTAYVLISGFGEDPEFTRHRTPAPYLETCYISWNTDITASKADNKDSKSSDKQSANGTSSGSSSSKGSSNSSNNDSSSKQNNTSKQSSASFTPTVPKKSDMQLEGVLRDLPESCQYSPTPCQPMSTEDIKERAGAAAIFYIEKSIIARKQGDYSIAAPYIAAGSPIETDMKKLVPGDASRGVSMTFEKFEILNVVDHGEGRYDVHLRNTYDIQGTKRTGLRTFESVLRIVYNSASDTFYAYELISETEI